MYLLQHNPAALNAYSCLPWTCGAVYSVFFVKKSDGANIGTWQEK
ncbi:predicted protein [Plenodomus lingam JN3]|uniref:Predicted protein n=1 Tax=Leptosphaeria maculans (strain JN3 / isolate v23.1.3 / race Av1-4-5-6-7-8) TaxID=985895 RepID=E5R4F1_LEPMJ|nr:predicted protein [Plenodomus lingam JN3]CBX91919.1 predicted protein [Plenodomus lingam JN3]